MTEESNRVSFHFHMGRQGEAPSAFAVEKDEGGRRRRFLEGVTSGLKVDGHGERMTDKCIKSFQRQATSGDILLYEGQHGVDFTDDIGVMVASSVDEQGDWHARFRLYDELDSMGGVTLERAEKLWKQVNGQPPYTKPRQKGFSIEGEIPEGGLVYANSDGKLRVMDDVLLDGVLVVNRPAYYDSIAHAVYKALGIPGPWKVRKDLERSLASASGPTEGSYFRRYFRLQDALDARVTEIMGGPDVEKSSQLRTVYNEFADLAIAEAMRSPDVFKAMTEREPQEGIAGRADAEKRLHALRQLEAALSLELELRKRSISRR